MAWGRGNKQRRERATVAVVRNRSAGAALHICRLSAALFCGLLCVLTAANPVHAASSGCLAVRSGALNVTANDLIPDFVGNFEAGETVVWTFAGSAIQQDVAVVPPGGNLPVSASRTITFTFPNTGTFTIQESVSGTVTATCNETTAETQAAVQAAVKTITELQLARSVGFQGALLSELTGLFLTGAVPTIILERLQQQLAEALQAKAQLNVEANNLRWFIADAPRQIRSARGDLDRLIEGVLVQSATHPELYPLVSRCAGCGPIYVKPIDIINKYRELKESQEQLINALGRRSRYLPAEIADRALKREAATREAQEYHDGIVRSFPEPEDARLRESGLNNWRQIYHHPQTGLVVVAERNFNESRAELAAIPGKIAEAEAQRAKFAGEIAKWQTEKGSRDTRTALLEGRISGLTQQVQSSEARLAEISGELSAMDSRIADIQNQISTLQARVGQPLPSQFAAANLQAALGLGQDPGSLAPGSTAYARNALGLNGSKGGLSFFTDLNSLRRSARSQARHSQAGALGLEVLTETGSAEILNPTFNVWAKGDFADFESEQPGADRKGQAYTFATGAYIAPSARFMIGTMYRYRKSESESRAQNTDVDSRGNGAGLYSTLVLSPMLSLSGQILYERSENDIARTATAIAPVATTGSYDSDQYVATGSIQGTFWRRSFWLRPAAGLTYAHVDTESYVDSAGTLIPGQTIEQMQFTFGPTFGYRAWREGRHIRFIEPSLSINGIWTLKDEGDTTLASGAIIKQDDASATFSGGLSILLQNDIQLSLNGGYSGLGESKVESYSVGGQVSIPFGRQ